MDRESIDIRDFQGLQTNADPLDLANGSTIQENITCVKPGQLTVRAGMREIEWDN